MESIKHFFLLLPLLLLTTCASDRSEGNAVPPAEELSGRGDSVTAPVRSNEPVTQAESVLGERIDGPANIRNSINGKLLFTLEDNVQVTSTALQDDWYSIGILMDIDKNEAELTKISAGRKITVEGREVGLLKSDMEVYPSSDGTRAWVELIGYTHKDNIKPATIIENVLADQLQTISGDRTVDEFRTFIRQFQLEKTDQLADLTVYYYYENWIEDPSPMWRIGLVFRENKLIAILHSRPLSASGTTDHQLPRAFDCLTYNDISNSGEIVELFNQFVNSVD